ncbi:hypothetical protein W02_27300 [Nitrospira sp. KM1]|uniref:hypothetical protein n=1 Tax=Nitrospira sp. KM1 TaxID=1936990 RepID=UPI0013A75DD3|nr:hypothetical protein [Nitrospira sp. KM1]BCA55590.1 hypothetical protein W02_27300 [Nitrospira sp. KM1]
MALWSWVNRRAAFRTASDQPDVMVLRLSLVRIGMCGALLVLLITATVYGIHLLMIAANEREIQPILEDCHTVQECAGGINS